MNPQGDEELRQLAELCRRHPPDDPGDTAWAGMSDRIAAALPRVPRAPRWDLRLAGVAAASVLAFVLLGRSWLPDPVEPEPDEEEPFPVAVASEINIISMDAGDADRVAMGKPLLGRFEVATADEVKVEQMEPNPEDGAWPEVRREGGLAMILAGEDEP